MGKIEKNRIALISILEEYAQHKPFNIQDVENQVLVDKKNGHYQLVSMGWEGRSFNYTVIYHFDLKPDGKIWIQVNNTDVNVASELVDKGVFPTDIVIGFQYPAYRQYTGYAVA